MKPTANSTSFTQGQERLAETFKALGHPARIAIINFLVEKETCICGDIVKHLPLSQSTVSQHLAVLKNAGIIHGSIQGPRVCYCINPKHWDEVSRVVEQFFSRDAGSDSCC